MRWERAAGGIGGGGGLCPEVAVKTVCKPELSFHLPVTDLQSEPPFFVFFFIVIKCEQMCQDF